MLQNDKQMENTLKQLSFLLMILVLGLSCSKDQKVLTKRINITLIDNVNDLPIDSAKVILNSIVGAKDIYTDIKYTDSFGLCSFSFEFKPETDFKITAQKDKYWDYLVDDSINISKSSIRIEENTEKNQFLYLTSDSNQNIEFWKKKMPRYDIDSLISMLKSNSYNSRFPLLIWEDIPSLIKIANDTTLISNFPHNGLSSYLQKECYLGVLSMWLIESIRITEKLGVYSIFGNLPSLNPILNNINGTEFRYQINTIKEMEAGYNLYLEWWEKIKNMDKRDAFMIDPLKNSDIEW